MLLSSSPLQPTGPLLQGIGFIPFDWITAGGLADTTAFDPSYFYPVTNAPFGGSLPVMVNFLRAGLDGASFYRVKVDGNLRTDVFNTAKWNGTEYVPTVFGPQTVGGNPGYYPVPSVSDLMLYIQPLPGCYLDSTNLASAQTHTITVDFFDASANPVESATPLVIYVDNNPCFGVVGPRRHRHQLGDDRLRIPSLQPGHRLDRQCDHRIQRGAAGGLRQLVVLADQSRNDDRLSKRARDLAANPVQPDGRHHARHLHGGRLRGVRLRRRHRQHRLEPLQPVRPFGHPGVRTGSLAARGWLARWPSPLRPTRRSPL